MNISTLFGFALALFTVWAAVIKGSPNPQALLHIEGILLIFGGTLSAGLIIYPFSKLLDLGKFVLYAVVLKQTPEPRRLVKEIVSASLLPKHERDLLFYLPCSHPYLREGFKLLYENELNEADLFEVLSRRSQYFKTSYTNDAKMLSILAKFPSSFGMLGSTVGLIDMMSNLSKNGSEGIGPAMALALVATFWGLVLTYMVFMPLSDYAIRLNAEDGLIRQLIQEGLLMIKREEDPHVVLAKLNGFLALHDRMGRRNLEISQRFWEETREQINQIRQKAG